MCSFDLRSSSDVAAYFTFAWSTNTYFSYLLKNKSGENKRFSVKEVRKEIQH